MGLRADHKREAIRLFKVGASPDFDPQDTLRSFHEICGKRPQLKTNAYCVFSQYSISRR